MTKGITIKRRFRVQRGKSNRQQIREGDAQQGAANEVPRISRLMALAIRFDQLIRTGLVADQAELARLGFVSRARLTQIMNLLSLAPAIQDALLHSAAVHGGRKRISERQLRPVAAEPNWTKQWARWVSMQQ